MNFDTKRLKAEKLFFSFLKKPQKKWVFWPNTQSKKMFNYNLSKYQSSEFKIQDRNRLQEYSLLSQKND